MSDKDKKDEAAGKPSAGNGNGNGNNGNNGNGNGNNGSGPKEDKKISLTVIVSGTGTVVEANPKQKIRVIAEKALQETGNTGRPLSDWTVKTRHGDVLDLDKTVEDYGFKDGDQIVMSLQAGVGGCRNAY